MKLTRGQRADLPSGWEIGVIDVQLQLGGWSRADAHLLALPLHADNTVHGGNQLVSADGGSTPCRGVLGYLGNQLRIELARLPASVARIAIALSNLPGTSPRQVGRQLGPSSIRVIHDRLGEFNFEFSGSDFGSESALVLVELYRRGAGWRITAPATGFVGGLGAMLVHYRGELPELPHPAPSPPPSASGASAAAPNAAGQGSLALPASALLPLRLPTTYPGQLAPKVPGMVMPALGLIEVGTEMGTANGTGWVVSPGGWVVTCAHVVESAIWLRFIPEGETLPRSLELAATDEGGDLALLRLTDGAGSQHWLPIASEATPPALGDEVAILGYPLGKQLGLTLTYTQGIVNSVRESEGVSMIQVDAGAAPGSSGGPVFRRSDGAVVGVLASGLKAETAGMLINFASGIQRLRQLGWIAR